MRAEKIYRKNPKALVEKERDDDLDVVFSRFEITGSQVWVGWQHEYLNAEWIGNESITNDVKAQAIATKQYRLIQAKQLFWLFWPPWHLFMVVTFQYLIPPSMRFEWERVLKKSVFFLFCFASPNARSWFWTVKWPRWQPLGLTWYWCFCWTFPLRNLVTFLVILQGTGNSSS